MFIVGYISSSFATCAFAAFAAAVRLAPICAVPRTFARTPERTFNFGDSKICLVSATIDDFSWDGDQPLIRASKKYREPTLPGPAEFARHKRRTMSAVVHSRWPHAPRSGPP